MLNYVEKRFYTLNDCFYNKHTKNVFINSFTFIHNHKIFFSNYEKNNASLKIT